MAGSRAGRALRGGPPAGTGGNSTSSLRPAPAYSPRPFARLLRGNDDSSGAGGHDEVMTTARTAPPGQSAPTFSPGSEQYVDGLPPGFIFPGTENLNPAEIFSGPGYTAPRPRTDSGATAALVCGLLGLVPLVGVAAIILGIGALRRLRRSYNSGEGIAWLGLILGVAFTLLWLLIALMLLVF